MKKDYAKLDVLLATDAPAGLVIRHGTRKSVCTLLWDRKKDTFTLGQWMRGRIDVETCDLSPDGKHFLYSASKRAYWLDGWVERSGVERWTVVSRTPYLKALAYYPRYIQGGWFVNSSEYCVLDSGANVPEDREHPEVRRVLAAPPQPSLIAARMQRGGWTVTDNRAKFAGRIEFTRDAGAGWELRKHPRRGYELIRDGHTTNKADWGWAGVDGDRIVWTSKGCLWAGKMKKDGLQEARILHDFNDMEFEAIAAPYEGGRAVIARERLLPPAQTSVPARPRGSIKKKKPDRRKVHVGADD